MCFLLLLTFLLEGRSLNITPTVPQLIPLSVKSLVLFLEELRGLELHLAVPNFRVSTQSLMLTSLRPFGLTVSGQGLLCHEGGRRQTAHRVNTPRILGETPLHIHSAGGIQL